MITRTGDTENQLIWNRTPLSGQPPVAVQSGRGFLGCMYFGQNESVKVNCEPFAEWGKELVFVSDVVFRHVVTGNGDPFNLCVGDPYSTEFEFSERAILLDWGSALVSRASQGLTNLHMGMLLITGVDVLCPTAMVQDSHGGVTPNVRCSVYVGYESAALTLLGMDPRWVWEGNPALADWRIPLGTPPAPPPYSTFESIPPELSSVPFAVGAFSLGNVSSSLIAIKIRNFSGGNVTPPNIYEGSPWKLRVALRGYII